MARILRMPEVLANATEAVIAAWLVEEGMPFSTGTALAEIETEKALVELAAEEDGILGRHLVKVGDPTAVGAPIAVLIDAEETQDQVDAQLHILLAEVAGTEVSGAAVGPAAELPAQLTPEKTPQPTPEPAAADARLFSSPLARRVAREHGVDPRTVAGSGPGGRIIRRDVEAAIRSSRTASAAPAASAGEKTPAPPSGYTVIPHTGMRRAIARRLTESKSTVPHFYLSTACRVDDLLALRRQLGEVSAVKISVNDLVVKAAAGAFHDIPDANVTWSDEGLRRYDQVDIAVAVATDGGLLTPVARAVDRLGLVDLATAIGELVARARSGRLRQDELEGGSFAVTNLGMYGTTEFAAILNPPQSGILAVGAARQEATVIDGELTVATMMHCTVSVDHRAVDGALAAQWLAAFTYRMEHPVSMLI